MACFVKAEGLPPFRQEDSKSLTRSPEPRTSSTASTRASPLIPKSGTPKLPTPTAEVKYFLEPRIDSSWEGLRSSVLANDVSRTMIVEILIREENVD